MRKRLFQPFRFAYWSRIAVLGVFAGELSFNSGSGGSGRRHLGTTPGISPFPHSAPHAFAPGWIPQHLHIIFAVIATVVLVSLLFLYIGSVLRFVLFEAVLRDKARIRQGFARWSGQGWDYFLFRLILVVPVVAIAFYLVALPLFRVISAGGGAPEILSAVVPLVGALLLVGLLGILLAVVMVFTKDFVIPQMIFEGVGCAEAWGRLWLWIKAEPGSFIGYLLLKIVLGIAAFIAYALVLIVGLLIVIIPVGITVAAGVVLAKVVGGTTLAIAAGVLLGLLIALPAIVFCVGFLGAPVSVFFPAYAIYFLASRYRPLYDEVYPPPPSSQPLPTT
jgi:hypothetical protein